MNTRWGAAGDKQAVGKSVSGRIYRPLLISSVFSVANGTLIPFVGLTLAYSNFDVETISWVAFAYYLGWLSGAVGGTIFIPRVKPSLAVASCAALATAGCIMLVAHDSNLVWFLSRFVCGLAMGAYYVAIESWINLTALNHNRARSLGAYGTVRLTMVMFGPSIAVALTFLQTERAFILFAIVFFSAALVAFYSRQGTSVAGTQRRPYGMVRFSQLSILGLTGALLIGWSNAAFHSLAPVFGENVGLTKHGSSLLLLCFVAGSATIQLPVGYLSDRFGRRPVLLGCSALAAGIACVIALRSSASLPELLVLHVLLGGSSAPIYISLVATAVDELAPSEIATMNGLFVIAYGIGNLGAAPASAALMVVLGPQALYVSFGTPLLILLAVHSLFAKTSRLADKASSFNPLLPNTKKRPADQ